MVVAFVLSLNLFNLIRFYGLEEMDKIREVPIGIWEITFNAFLGGTISGIIIGTFDNILDGRNIRQKSFGSVVLIKTAAYITAFFITITIVFFSTNLIMLGFTFPETVENFGIFIKKKVFFVYIVYGLIVIFIINFIKQADRKVGPGILFKFFMGKYHKPIEEERVFMFLDLKSSTTIAEKLGHIRYSNLIQDCFLDLTEVVRNHNAEIYQYVGDEAVLTWKIEDGINDANCIGLYFEYDRALKKKEAYYIKNYDTLPIFKAGINCGTVTAAEVGEIKSEIAYHGDVLNTAARIQSQCNVLHKNLLISEYLKEMLEKFPSVRVENIGEIVLRGKEKPIGIYSIEIVES